MVVEDGVNGKAGLDAITGEAVVSRLLQVVWADLVVVLVASNYFFP